MTASARITNIQFLRGGAALLVVLEHIKNAICTIYLKVSPDELAISAFPLGFGVDIFFVVSGFVMAYSSERLHGEPGAWRRLLGRRMVRVVPLYWVTTAALIAIFMVTHDAQWRSATWWSVIGSFLFVPTLNSAGQPLPIYPVGWTLNHEMFFYALFAVFVGLPARRAVAAISATLLTLVGYGIIVDPVTPILDVWSAPIMIEFIMGIGLYELHRAGLTRLPANVVVAGSVVAVVALTKISNPGDARALLWGMPAAMIVVAGLSLPNAPRRLSTFAGDISYAAYLVHILVILALSSIFNRWLPRTDFVWLAMFPIATIAATVAAAMVARRFIEIPAMRLAPPFSTIPTASTPGGVMSNAVSAYAKKRLGF